MATRQLLCELADAYASLTGTDVQFESAGGVDAAKRVAAGDPFDVVVLASDSIDQLAAAGRVLSESAAALVRSGVAVAVRRGAPWPVIRSEGCLRASVLAARAIGYSTGPSGAALQRLFERWGIADRVRERMVQAPPGVAVGNLVARGDVELGFQQLSELMHLDDIEVVGPMPDAVQIVTTFSGAVCSRSEQPDAVRALLDFMRSPSAADAKRRHGMEPA